MSDLVPALNDVEDVSLNHMVPFRGAVLPCEPLHPVVSILGTDVDVWVSLIFWWTWCYIGSSADYAHGNPAHGLRFLKSGPSTVADLQPLGEVPQNIFPVPVLNQKIVFRYLANVHSYHSATVDASMDQVGQ